MGQKTSYRIETDSACAAKSRQQMIFHTSLLCVVTGVILSCINCCLHHFITAAVEILLALFALISTLNISRFRSLDRVAECVLSAGIILLLMVLFTGGILQTGLHWFPFFSAIAFFWLTPKKGTCWTLGLLASTLVITLLSMQGLLTLAFPPVQIGMALLVTTVIGFIAFLYEKRRALDATALRQTINELDEARHQAERVANAKDQFLAHMSHEIRTPLNGVIGMANVLLQSKLKENQHESASMIHDSATVLLSLINNVLDFTRMEAGRLKLENAPFNMHMLLEEVTRVIATPAYQKGVEIILDYDKALPSHVMGDKKHLRQIMINLAGNAVKFTPVGHVLLRVTSVIHSQYTDQILFEVNDTGIGIPEDQQDLIFDQFRQANTSTQSSFEGSGLGLAISDRLVQMMGGEISINSTPNQGSTFSFELSLETLPGKSMVPTQRLADRRVLIIEPYKPLAEVLQYQVNLLGATTEVHHGKNALEDIKKSKPFDIIIVDHCHQDKALQLAVAIQKLDRQSRPLIYLLKAPTTVIAAEDLKVAGISATITKPIIQRELSDRLLNLYALEEKRPRKRPAKKQNLHVLLVEDNRVNQRVARHFLENLGCKVDLAINGREAVNAAFSEKYDLIFMDCQMPEMDGYEATRVIRSNEKLSDEPRHVPIIALTAHAFDSDRAKCISIGMDDYLSKPIDQKKLKTIISAYSIASFD